jgi:hypothetical protein
VSLLPPAECCFVLPVDELMCHHHAVTCIKSPGSPGCLHSCRLYPYSLSCLVQVKPVKHRHIHQSVLLRSSHGMQLGVYALVGVLGSIFVVQLLVQLIQQPVRDRQLHKFAERMGFHFDGELDRSFDDTYQHFELFKQGLHRVAHPSLFGTYLGVAMRMGDFESQQLVTRGKVLHQQRTRMSYLLATIPLQDNDNTSNDVPRLQLVIRREGLIDDVSDALGFDDVDFANKDAFNERFHVEGSSGNNLLVNITTP